MRCYNTECGSNDADEWCIGILINECEDVPEIEYVDGHDDENHVHFESNCIATLCKDCNRLTYRSDWITAVLDFTKPANQAHIAIVADKE